MPPARFACLAGSFFVLSSFGCGSRSSLLWPVGDGLLADGPGPIQTDRPALEPGWSRLPAGSFTMGSPKSEPCREAGSTRETQHQVTLTRAFTMGQTEVTQAEHQKLRGYNPSRFTACGGSCPVERVSWHEAAAACNARSQAEGLPTCYNCGGTMQNTSCTETAEAAGRIHTCKGYRLPTEAEWEYAYRAGTTTALYNGTIRSCENDSGVDEVGWYLHNSSGTTHPSRQKKANAWGLHDLPGNVWEWCNDGFREDLGPAAATDPQGSSNSLSKVLRGSSWVDTAGHLRAADRFGHPPVGRNSNIGFRCVRSL